MNKLTSTNYYRRYFFVLLVLIFSCIVIATTTRVRAESSVPAADEHIITLHDDGIDKGFVTKKATLREALHDANIRLDDNDRTEPALDERLVATSYQVNIYRARPVVVRDGANTTKILTAYRTPKQIAAHAKIALHDADKTTLAPSRDPIVDGAAEVMTISRATEFTFEFYGKTATDYTMARTVGEMLQEKHITLDKDDGMTPSADTPITPGMLVRLWRNGVQTVTVDEDVTFATRQVKDADKEVGFKEVQTPGKNGKRTVTYEITMQNGIETARKEVKSNTTLEPVEQVEIIGTKFSNTFSGSFAEALARLRSCEGSYTSNTGNGYYGAYQYDIQTWGGYQGYPNASVAPPEVQDQKVWETYQRRGWQPWPSCSRKMGLQDIYR